jgi:IstB-like ATP binding protein
MNTRREGFSAGCSAFSALRAAATSGRSCSAACRTFFKRDLVALVEAPHRADSDSELLLAAKPVANLLKCQIRLLRHEIEQPLLVRLERRTTVPSAWFRRNAARSVPPVKPTHCCRGSKVEHTRGLPPALPFLHYRNRALAQVLRVTLRHRIPPPLPTEHSNLICATLGIPCGCSDSHQVESALALESAITKLDRYDLLILDDIAYVTKDQAETSVLFELIAARYERRSLLITANQPFGEWGRIFPDQAMTLAAIDRLVHHATILEMNVESYRRKAALDRKRGRGRPPAHATPKEVEKNVD